MSTRAVTLEGQELPKGWPGIVMKSSKEFPEIRYHSYTVNLCNSEAEGEGKTKGAAPNARVVKFLKRLIWTRPPSGSSLRGNARLR